MFQSLGGHPSVIEGYVDKRQRERNNVTQKIDNLNIEHGETVFVHNEVREAKKGELGVLVISNYRVHKYCDVCRLNLFLHLLWMPHHPSLWTRTK